VLCASVYGSGSVTEIHYMVVQERYVYATKFCCHAMFIVCLWRPRRWEGGRSPQVALAPYEPWCIHATKQINCKLKGRGY
jgi:hypothetical protein